MHEPLTVEERELADRLARLGASGEPSSALDARILAAAHAAATGSRTRRPSHRSRPRWPLALGAVATLALAVGVAWQLRPAPESAQVYSEAPAAAMPMDKRASGPSADAGFDAASGTNTARANAPTDAAAATADLSAEPAEQPQMPEQDAGSAAEVQQQDAPEQSEAAPAPAPAPPPPPAPVPQASREEIVFDVPAPAASAPAAPAAPGREQEPAAAMRRAPANEAKARQSSDALDSITVTGSRIERDNAGFEDRDIDDQPPATADSPQVQRAWLQRIRELLSAGEADAARDSLEEFRRRHPDFVLPPDLRDLGD